MDKINNITAIKEFFSTPERPLTMAELRALTAKDRAELGALCAPALGKELDPATIAANLEAMK